MDMLVMLFGNPAAMLTGPWMPSTNVLTSDSATTPVTNARSARIKVVVGPFDRFRQSLGTIRRRCQRIGSAIDDEIGNSFLLRRCACRYDLLHHQAPLNHSLGPGSPRT